MHKFNIFSKSVASIMLALILSFSVVTELPLPAFAVTTEETVLSLGDFSITNIKNTDKGIRLTWEPSENTESYRIYRKTSSGKYASVKEITDPSVLAYTDTSAKNGIKYSYIVRAYNGSGNLNCLKSKSYVRITTPTIKSIENSGDYQLAVKWNKNSKATGYKVAYSYYEDFSKYKTATSAVGGKYLNNLADSTSFYVKVRTYITIGKTTYYSAWSEAEEEWIDYVPPRPDGKGYVINTNTLKFHVSTCYHVDRIHAENYDRHSSRSDLIDWGYSPCNVCKP